MKARLLFVRLKAILILLRVYQKANCHGVVSAWEKPASRVIAEELHVLAQGAADQGVDF